MKNDHSVPSTRAENGFIHWKLSTGPPITFLIFFLAFCAPTRGELLNNDFRHFCIIEIQPKDAAQLVEHYIGLTKKSAGIVIKTCKDFLERQRRRGY